MDKAGCPSGALRHESDPAAEKIPAMRSSWKEAAPGSGTAWSRSLCQDADPQAAGAARPSAALPAELD